MILESIIYHLDLFKTPMALLFNSKLKVPSLLGSLISIGIIIFLLIFFLQSDIFTKKNPISSIQSLTTSQRPTLNFDYSNMALAFGLANSVNQVIHDPSIFSFTLYAYAYTGSGETIYEINKTLSSCKEENFKNYGTNFKDLDMQKYFCIDGEGNFTLGGYWDEKIVKYIDFTLNRCKNESSNNTCKSEEDIQNFFQDKYLNIYFADQMVDVNNYENPIQTLYKNRFFLMDGKISKKVTFYFKKVEFVDDNGAIFPSVKTLNSFLFGNFEVDYSSENIAFFYTHLLKYM